MVEVETGFNRTEIGKAILAASALCWHSASYSPTTIFTGAVSSRGRTDDDVAPRR
jgi:hypothetical protein